MKIYCDIIMFMDMNYFDPSAIELLMDNMKQGIVYVDKEQKIRVCNNTAKDFTGITFDFDLEHDAGQIVEGDIVVIADNSIGGDDGNLNRHLLEKLNIYDENIEKGQMFVAVGVYGNTKIDPRYKYLKEQPMDTPFKISATYLGFEITTLVDTSKRTTVITVNDMVFRLDYYSEIGNMVVIDGGTGRIKFFQAKGYSVRKEDISSLLEGGKFGNKSKGMKPPNIVGTPILDIFHESELTDKIFEIIDGNCEAINNTLFEINKRPFICNIIPWRKESQILGAFLLINDVGQLETILNERDEILKQIEDDNKQRQSFIDSYPDDAFSAFLGVSNKAREVKYMAYKASQSKFNVIITGASGTGKSKLAKEIHALGNPNSPFIEVNCNAIAPTLFESELFGYVGGAFTGAKSEGKVGFFEAANNGTIFLDEIGEIPLDIQVKLLHVLQDKIIYKVGSSKPIKVNVRVIAATNKDLQDEVLRGNFRQDLFYRINVFPIEIPPIKERKPDLYLLINQILKSVCQNYELLPKQFSGGAWQKLIGYNWPGNVRELENVIERAVTICEGNIIYPEHLRFGHDHSKRTMKDLLEEEEKHILEAVLFRFDGDKKKAMDELDLSKSVFYSKLKKYGL